MLPLIRGIEGRVPLRDEIGLAGQPPTVRLRMRKHCGQGIIWDDGRWSGLWGVSGVSDGKSARDRIFLSASRQTPEETEAEGSAKT